MRRILGGVKVGHAGTLDPAATGLLVLGVGLGTKNLTALTKLDKKYMAEILLGRSTTTGDREGAVVNESSNAFFTKPALLEAVAGLVGEHTLPVSAYSAIKKDRKPMYKRAYEAARKGKVITELPTRKMTVLSAQFTGYRTTVIDDKTCLLMQVYFQVASGTYIRSLAEALGQRLGVPASLYSLRRTKVGDYDIKNATTLERLAADFGVPLY